jgi:hypothetical protein
LSGRTLILMLAFSPAPRATGQARACDARPRSAPGLALGCCGFDRAQRGVEIILVLRLELDVVRTTCEDRR